jgi:hypothetical protein
LLSSTRFIAVAAQTVYGTTLSKQAKLKGQFFLETGVGHSGMAWKRMRQPTVFFAQA